MVHTYHQGQGRDSWEAGFWLMGTRAGNTHLGTGITSCFSGELRNSDFYMK